MEVLKSNLPEHINLQTLLEVIEPLNAKGVPDIEIEEFLATPPSSWKKSIFKN